MRTIPANVGVISPNKRRRFRHNAGACSGALFRKGRQHRGACSPSWKSQQITGHKKTGVENYLQPVFAYI